MTNLDQMIADMKKRQAKAALTVAITPAQLKTLASIRKRMLDWSHDLVWKSWEVTIQPGGRLSVTAELGHKDDEGTLAAVFCRDSWHLFVGRRGGLSAVNDEGKVVKGRKAFFTGKRK